MQAIRNIARTLAPGSGKVFFRDYAQHDLAAARLHKVPHVCFHGIKHLEEVCKMIEFVGRNRLGCCTGGQGSTAGAWCLLPQRWHPHILFQQCESLQQILQDNQCNVMLATACGTSLVPLPLPEMQMLSR